MVSRIIEELGENLGDVRAERAWGARAVRVRVSLSY